MAANVSANQDRTAGGDVYARIKAEILSNALTPGHQLHEQEIAAQFGTSRTPVREAMIRLENEGLIEVIPRKGIRVVPVDAGDMAEIYDVLCELEGLAAKLIIAQDLPPDAFDKLQGLADEMTTALENDELQIWARGDDAFHQEVMLLTGNSRLQKVTEELYAQAHRTQIITLRLRQSLAASNEEHAEIIRCLREGRRDAACDALYQHRRRGGDTIITILNDYGLPPL